MRIGLNTLLFTAGFDREHLPLLAQVKRWGFDGIEIARFAFDGFPAREIGQAARDEGLGVTFCSALTGGVSLVSGDAAVRAQALDFLKSGIDTAREIGSDIFLGPFCAPVGHLPGRRPDEQEWAWAVEGLQGAAAHAAAAGVRIANEPLNRFETYFLNTAARARALCDAVGNQAHGILFDTFHANIEEQSFGEALRACGPHLAHVHACENDRGAPGSGHVAWTEVFATLKEMDYNGWVVIESFGARIPEIAAAACIWRDLAESPEALAQEGLRFLRDGLG